MQTTSATFAPYADARHCDIRVSFRLVDTDAAADATATAAQYNTGISQLAQTHDGTGGMTKYATLETHGWPLDGSCGILPDSVSGIQTGYWSNISGADGTFSTAPTLTFSFTGDHSSVGFTVMFDWIYPKAMTITAYDSTDTVIDQEAVTVTSQRCVTNMPVENYRKVALSFSETQLPYQRVRISEVVFGIVQLFDKSNTTNAELLYEVSLNSESLPANELTITFDNTDADYNLINPNGLYAYLQQGQPLDAEMGIGGEYVNMGRFYFAKSEAQDGAMTAQITAYDRLYQLDKSICRIGTTGTWTAYQALAAVIADCGLTITTSIPAEISALTINKCIPAVSHREALRLIAQAAMCSCYFDRDDTLVFKEIEVGTSADILNNDNMSVKAKVTVTDRINTVELTVRDEYADTETVYTAADVESGETAQVWSVNNPLANQATADWLLQVAQTRRKHKLSERGNPAREATDTITIYDAYGGHADAVIIKEAFSFNGGLSCETEAMS